MNSFNNKKLEFLLSSSLRVGVILCALLIGSGVLLGLASQQGGLRENLQQLVRSQPVVQEASVLDYPAPNIFIALGLAVLILLPVVRVSLTLLMFWVHRDYFYVGVTLLVLFGVCGGLFSVSQMKHPPAKAVELLHSRER